MKNIFSILFFAALAISSTYAQTILNEAFIQFEMTEVSSIDPQTESMLQMMKGSTVDIYFKKERQRVNLDMMGGMVKMVTFVGQDGEKPNVMFMDMMGRKMKIAMDDDQMKQYQGQSAEVAKKPTVKNISGEGRTILGYECKKVELTYPEEQEMTLIAYVTDKIQSPASVIQNASADVDLGGFPLAYTISHPQMTMTYEATELDKAIPSGTFDLLTGYEEMDFNTFIQSMGAMQGMGQ